MRILFVLLAACIGLAASVPASRAGEPADWRQTVIRLPDSGLAVGNPEAKVRLTEYLSYTCPHCAHYVAESEDGIDAMIRGGDVRVEMISAVRDPLDMAAAMLVRCADPARFLDFHQAIFADQEALREKAAGIPAMYSRVPAMTNADAVAVARGSGLDELARSAGLSDAAVTKCLGDEAALNKLRAESVQAWDTIRGTPSFAVDGKLTMAGGWDDVRQLLVAAGAD